MLRFASALAAFGSITAIGAAAFAQSSPPVITFDADWSITQSAPLVAGQSAVFRYNTNRLPSCRATYNGLPAWAITASYEADSSSTVPTLTVNDGSSSSNPIDVGFVVPYGADLSVWFHNSDEWGCSTWDSSYGQNFHFAIQGPPTIHFNVDWTNPVAGTLASGASIAIDYDVRRLSTCRSTYNGYQAWDVSVAYRFDGGAVSYASLTQVVGMYGRGQAPAVISAPAGAHQIEMWFENTDVDGCNAYDSHYGQNYVFTLQ